MNVYALSLAIGAVGLLAMALTGLGRHGGGGGSHHVGAKLGGRGRAGHARAAGRPGHAHPSHSGGIRATALAWLWSLTSPRVLFSLLVGFGTTGLALRGVLVPPLLFAVALAGAALFETALVAPVWNFLLRFASAPALTLESCILDEVRAATRFDASGHGLVAAEVDGRVIQVLAMLRPEDRVAGVRIRAGDRLRIEDVDGRRNRCLVSYIGPVVPSP